MQITRQPLLLVPDTRGRWGGDGIAVQGGERLASGDGAMFSHLASFKRMRKEVKAMRLAAPHQLWPLSNTRSKPANQRLAQQQA